MLQNLRRAKDSKSPEQMREAIDLAVQSCEQIEKTMNRCLDDPKSGCMAMHKMAQDDSRKSPAAPTLPARANHITAIP